LLAERYGIARPVVLYNSCHLSSMPLGAETFRRHFGLGPEGGSPREGEAFAVMFQGGFLREKNVEALARAFVDLGPAYQLFLLGGGILEPRLKRMIKESAAANVHLGEWVEAEQLLGYLGHVHAGVIPYLDDGLPNNHYCTPNKLFEYLEAGLPICANELPELWRIVQGEGIGRTYPLNTTEEIAGAITDFAARYRAGEFEASAFAKARATYAWSKQAERLLALYEQLGV